MCSILNELILMVLEYRCTNIGAGVEYKIKRSTTNELRDTEEVNVTEVSHVH